MDFFDAVRARHSYRGPFAPSPVPMDDLRRILDAALRAPSGHNRQTTDFIAVLSEAVTCAGKAFALQDFAAVAVENLLLAATALGYASVWIEGALLDDDRATRLAALLSVPPGRTARAALPLDVPLEAGRQAEKLPFEVRVTII